MLRLLFILALVACHGEHAVRPLPPLPRPTVAEYLTGKLAMYQQDWPAAVAALAAAAAASPDEPMVAVELARAQAKAKQLDAARATLAHARAKWPDHVEVWLSSGELLQEPAEAIAAYRRAIVLARDDERGYLGLTRIALAQHRDAEADETLRKLVARVPGSVEGHYRLAQRLADNPAAQIAELRAVLDRDPDHIDARLELARTLRRTGHLADAIAQTRGAFDRAAQPLDIAEELFWLLCESGDREAAIDLLTLLDDDRSELDALATVARLDRGLGRLDAARAVAARIAARDADAGALSLAETELAEGDPRAAVTRALAIPATSEHAAEAQRFAAEALLAAGDAKRAGELIAPLRADKPRDVDLALVAAYALADAGSVAEARALLAPLPNAELARARLEDRLGAAPAALAILQRIVKDHPDAVVALNLAGYLLADANQHLDEAERDLKHARELAPGDPAILDSYGWLLYRRGQTRAAIAALDQAARFAPREAEILVHLATVWLSDHQAHTAAELLDRADALHPAPAVQRRIAAIRATLPHQ